MGPLAKPIHPSELIPSDWVLSESLLKAASLKVEYHLEKPAELYADKLSHHLLLVNKDVGSTRQVSRVGRDEFDGSYQDGDFFLVAANDKAAFWSWNGADEVIMFAIDPDALQRVADGCGCVSPGEVALKNIVRGRDAQLLWFAEQFQKELTKEGIGGRLYKDSLATLFEIYLLRNYCHQPLMVKQSEGGLSRPQLKRVLDYIDEHLEKSIGLEKLAAICGLSKYHFSKMFKDAMGIPPYRYLLLQRIERAKYHLKREDMSIGEIASACGFADQSHLSRHFTKSVGTTPRKFRELS